MLGAAPANEYGTDFRFCSWRLHNRYKSRVAYTGNGSDEASHRGDPPWLRRTSVSYDHLVHPDVVRGGRMNGPSDDGMARAARPTTNRSGFLRRVLSLGALAIVALTVLAACGPEVDKPYSTTSPASPAADDIQSLYILVFWLALIVFVGVQFAIVYTALRFRRTRTAKKRPAQIHGNTRLEITWTVIPSVVLLIILIPTITTLYDFDAAAQEGDLVVDVYGHQRRWEVQYGEDYGGDTIAAGLLLNTPENMATWLHDPGAVKPGNYMATQITEGLLTEEQIQELNE